MVDLDEKLSNRYFSLNTLKEWNKKNRGHLILTNSRKCDFPLIISLQIISPYKIWNFSKNEIPGADPGGGGGAPSARPPPPKIRKNMIFLRKIVIFHMKYPKNVRASLRN